MLLRCRAPILFGSIMHMVVQRVSAVRMPFGQQMLVSALPSFARAPWLLAEAEITKMELRDDGQFDFEQVVVRNASIRDHVGGWRAWLRVIEVVEPVDGNDLWENRSARFPRLRFLTDVEAQIRSLKSGTPELVAVNRRLLEIQNALSAWNFKVDPIPRLPTKLTPEHEGRRQKFNFPDVDGKIRCFDMHVRYTPGAGRIHMWFDRSDGTASIGHIGEKVP